MRHFAQFGTTCAIEKNVKKHMYEPFEFTYK